MRRGLFRRLLTERRATAAIEFCFVAPVMLALMAGIVELGRAFEVYASVNRLAARYAIAWADCQDDASWATCGSGQEQSLYTSTAAIQNFAPQLTNGASVRMFEIVMNGSTAQGIYNAYPSGAIPTVTELAAAQNAVAAGQGGSTLQTVIVVTASYAHTLVFFQTLMSPLIGANKLAISYTVGQLKST